MDEIKLSIIVAVYNHEQYVEQALRSILMQKTRFRYEVLVGEDCSTDGTAAVLRSLEKELPDCFTIFYRPRNLGEEGNNHDLQSRAQGEYIIFLEGDDYWTDENKLSIEVDFLDTHPDYIAVAHNTEVVDGKGNVRTDFVYPECKALEYTLSDFCNERLAGQTATLMFRNIYRDPGFPLLKLDVYYPGDQQKNFMLAAWGRVYCIQKKMSAYRYITESGNSYSATHTADLDWRRRQLRTYELMYRYTLQNKLPRQRVIICETMYLRCLASAVMDHLSQEYTVPYFVRRLICSRHPLAQIRYFAGMALNSFRRRKNRERL